jgi:hypothetical protein
MLTNVHAMQVIVPLIVTVVDLKEQVASANKASIRSGTLSAAAAAAGTQYATAAECREVLPKGNLATSNCSQSRKVVAIQQQQQQFVHMRQTVAEAQSTATADT